MRNATASSVKENFDLLAIARDRLNAVPEALAIPDIATPVLNRMKANALREAASVCMDYEDYGQHECSNILKHMADELDGK